MRQQNLNIATQTMDKQLFNTGFKINTSSNDNTIEEEHSNSQFDFNDQRNI